MALKLQPVTRRLCLEHILGMEGGNVWMGYWFISKTVQSCAVLNK